MCEGIDLFLREAQIASRKEEKFTQKNYASTRSTGLFLVGAHIFHECFYFHEKHTYASRGGIDLSPQKRKWRITLLSALFFFHEKVCLKLLTWELVLNIEVRNKKSANSSTHSSRDKMF